jgi:hypothetical protein
LSSALSRARSTGTARAPSGRCQRAGACQRRCAAAAVGCGRKEGHPISNALDPSANRPWRPEPRVLRGWRAFGGGGSSSARRAPVHAFRCRLAAAALPLLHNSSGRRRLHRGDRTVCAGSCSNLAALKAMEIAAAAAGPSLVRNHGHTREPARASDAPASCVCRSHAVPSPCSPHSAPHLPAAPPSCPRT